MTALPEEVRTVAVIGAGQMGNGIAHVFALAGYAVKIHDRDPERLDAALALIGKNVDRQVRKGLVTEDEKHGALERIRLAHHIDDVRDSDLIVESAVENEAIKRQIFETLCENLPPQTILTTNTSSISITRLAAATDRPHRFMGLHFMNPVPLMQLVELIRGIATDEPTYTVMKGVVASLGKTSASAEDFPAFIV
ncbi:MAG: 3-hydroxyacyl-CoA dehydrogenase NAD-binding domain-containing protein, partial [Pseudomonadota bacterium]